ncbi:hypothetical protein ACWKSP_05965 [Micromonosporaceae bacterium Da 78-11]
MDFASLGHGPGMRRGCHHTLAASAQIADVFADRVAQLFDRLRDPVVRLAAVDEQLIGLAAHRRPVLAGQARSRKSACSRLPMSLWITHLPPTR